MLKATISILFISHLIMYPSLGCDGKLVDHHTCGIVNTIWQKKIVPESRIKEIMGDLYLRKDFDSIKASFAPESFKKLFDTQCIKIHHGSFLYFANLCKSIYDSSDENDRVKVFEILKHVSQQFWEMYGRLQRRKEHKIHEYDFEWERAYHNEFWETHERGISSDGSLNAFFGLKADTKPHSEKAASVPIKCQWLCDTTALKPIADRLYESMRKEAIPLSSEEIKGQLAFLRQIDETQQTNICKRIYGKSTAFEESFEKITTKITGGRYLIFAATCMKLYEELGEFQEKVALLILYLEVSKRESEFLLARKKQRYLQDMKEDSYH
ncbi:MAG: hypothetical protein K2Y18_02250 [Alphaproteobacteria bacterium]|nr:hypothetical protein [Alphaproteobacteria bacterium]